MAKKTFSDEQMAIIAQIAAKAAAEAVKTALNTQAQAPTSGKKQSAQAGKKVELIEFKKANGEVKLVSQAQADAWTRWKDNGSGKSLDEVKELKPEITKKGRAYVKAHPNCTRKEAAANGCKNITKDGLKALKRELGVR